MYYVSDFLRFFEIFEIFESFEFFEFFEIFEIFWIFFKVYKMLLCFRFYFSFCKMLFHYTVQNNLIAYMFYNIIYFISDFKIIFSIKRL